MLAYDIYGIVAATIGAFVISDLFSSRVLKPLAHPFVSFQRYPHKEPGGRRKLFMSYLTTNLLLLVGNLTVMSYIHSTYSISLGSIIVFYVVGGGLLYRIRRKGKTDREDALKVLGTYCVAFTFLLLARVFNALFIHEAAFPFSISTFAIQEVVAVLICFLAVPAILSTIGEYLATKIPRGRRIN